MTKAYAVRAVRCDHRASDEEVYERLVAVTDPLDRSWAKIANARQVLIKVNMAMPPSNIHYFQGRRRELVDDAVFRAALRRLRERTSARIVVADGMSRTPAAPLESLNYKHILDEFGVEWIDASQPPFKLYEVPGGGNMFARYKLTAAIAESDAVVSIAKLKNHLFQGVTLSLKNLFGWPPLAPHGRTRRYYHHIIRLSYMLPDLGLIAQPCLNIVDGLTGQAKREWDGEGRICDALLAGDQTIATDACGAWLMGHDPAGDWPDQPYLRDRSALRVAADSGFGTVDIKQIDFQSEVGRPLAQFGAVELDSAETVLRWRETTCEQALYFRDNQKRFVDRYAGQFIMLQDNEVVWAGPDASDLPSRRDLAGKSKDSAIWLKLVDPEEVEGEHFEVYERELDISRQVRAARQ
jgi:uncharacterized protein (DUF362 family)